MERARKSNGKRPNVRNVDRLSALPHGVISHILSFLPTDLSVKTSILAKRWRFLWAHVPVLDLEGVYDSSQTTSLQKIRFPGIVSTVMLRHKVERSSYELQTCIAAAIERNVKNLDLLVNVELPRCVLTCKTLVDLRMDDGVTLPSSGPIYLPSLKKLYLFSVDSGVHLPRLLSGCPVLEELIIDQSLGDGYISSPTLKRLTIYFPYCSTAVKIYAPALRYLKVFDYMYEQISVSLMKSLIEADICLGTFSESDHSCVLKLLDRLCNVKCLNLSGFYARVRICSFSSSHSISSYTLFVVLKLTSLQIFSLPLTRSTVKLGSLTKLELSANWCFLTKFLESADHLRVLIIREVWLSTQY
ncbi:F-box/LRR-repeat protein at4g14103 [Phtheirospermum japonicum]|uniref:F-box/LRR-repeat protein at4g14103 n=1 Tax=Phtheirospermum japonicum TaxID=374723 RepID=A0A830CBD0_9LAMI|nr:F-box/LRR-repeat protein at4g14103 [Phtheirospermum japonicum]